jgi:uncharacterized protein (DUF1778 family)
MSGLAGKLKTEFLGARLTPAERKLLEHGAQLAGANLSEFVLSASLREARERVQRVLQEEEA